MISFELFMAPLITPLPFQMSELLPWTIFTTPYFAILKCNSTTIEVTAAYSPKLVFT